MTVYILRQQQQRKIKQKQMKTKTFLYVYTRVGQGRLDGAFCDYTENDKMEYLGKLRDFGVINIEMECTTFAALTYHAGIRSAIVCVALLDRLKGDQVRVESKKFKI